MEDWEVSRMDGWRNLCIKQCLPKQSNAALPGICHEKRSHWDAVTTGTDMQNLNGCEPFKNLCVGERRCQSCSFCLHRPCTEHQKNPRELSVH